METSSSLVAIGCSWLNEQSFCEYKLYLKHCKGVQVEETKEMLAGTKDHETALSDHLKKADVKMNKEDALKSDLDLIAREFNVECTFEDVHLMGRIDEVHTSKECIIITDDKGSCFVGYGPRKQVGAYCLAMESMLEKLDVKKRVVGRLRHRETKEVFWENPFDENLKDEVLESIFRLRDVLTGKRRPEPTRNPKKCLKCNMPCDKRVAKYAGN